LVPKGPTGETRWTDSGMVPCVGPVTPIDWEAAGFTPEDASHWTALYFADDPIQASVWRDAGFCPEEAEAWHSALCLNELPDVLAWKSFGFTPEEARAWEGPAQGDPDDARAWTSGGFSPQEATSWGEFCDPEEATGWRVSGFLLEDARTWESLTFSPESARQWYLAGFEPFEVFSNIRALETHDPQICDRCGVNMWGSPSHLTPPAVARIEDFRRINRPTTPQADSNPWVSRVRSPSGRGKRDRALRALGEALEETIFDYSNAAVPDSHRRVLIGIFMGSIGSLRDLIYMGDFGNPQKSEYLASRMAQPQTHRQLIRMIVGLNLTLLLMDCAQVPIVAEAIGVNQQTFRRDLWNSYVIANPLPPMVLMWMKDSRIRLRSDADQFLVDWYLRIVGQSLAYGGFPKHAAGCGQLILRRYDYFMDQIFACCSLDDTSWKTLTERPPNAQMLL
jgi:hypothetical protein